MQVRLIKPGMSPPVEKYKQPSVEVPITDTIQSWVREFRATRANRTRLDFERISNSAKPTGNAFEFASRLARIAGDPAPTFHRQQRR